MKKSHQIISIDFGMKKLMSQLSHNDYNQVTFVVIGEQMKLNYYRMLYGEKNFYQPFSRKKETSFLMLFVSLPVRATFEYETEFNQLLVLNNFTKSVHFFL